MQWTLLEIGEGWTFCLGGLKIGFCFSFRVYFSSPISLEFVWHKIPIYISPSLSHLCREPMDPPKIQARSFSPTRPTSTFVDRNAAKHDELGYENIRWGIFRLTWENVQDLNVSILFEISSEVARLMVEHLNVVMSIVYGSAIQPFP